MEILIPFIKVIHIIVCLLLIVFVLLQPGKGGDLGSVFGGGSSESLFGSSGAMPFLAKLTRLFAVVFAVTSLSLGYFSVRSIQSTVIKDTPAVEQTAPAADDLQGGTSSDQPEDVSGLSNQEMIDSLTAPQEETQTEN